LPPPPPPTTLFPYTTLFRSALARLNGHPVGVIANQPMVLGGALDLDSADKAARFIMLCDAFGIPLVFLQDVPGFMVGSKVERAGDRKSTRLNSSHVAISYAV